MQVDGSTGEKHIADVKNPYGLVIEFQHSRITPDERKAREDFYGQMIWVVDGKRGELDEAHFNLGLEGPIQNDPVAYQVNWYGPSRFLHNWSDAGAHVYLDFGKDHLWRLVLFDVSKKIGAVGLIPKSTFIEDCLSGTSVRAAVRK